MERKEVFQYKYTITVPREKFLKHVVENEGLDLDDLRVCLLLLTELDGWDMSRRLTRVDVIDPNNYKIIDIKAIADKLHMKKKDVKESIKVLLREEIIESGSGSSTIEGYRFTF